MLFFTGGLALFAAGGGLLEVEVVCMLLISYCCTLVLKHVNFRISHSQPCKKIV